MKLVSKSFYFMRHGQTEWNKEGRCMGQQGISLNEQGKQESYNAKITLSHLPITSIFHSPLKRAQETMEISTQDFNISKIAVDDLKEWHFGEWESSKWNCPVSDDISIINPPQGETSAQFLSRSLKALNYVLDQEGTPLIVAHSGTYWAINYFIGSKIEHLGNCGIVQFVPQAVGWDIICLE